MTTERALVRHRSPEHYLLLAGSFAGLGLLALLHFLSPDPRGFGTHEQLGLPACMTIAWWNIPCPGCGVTTSLCLVAHGRLLESLHNQPLGLALGLTLAIAPTFALFQHLRHRDLLELTTRARYKPWIVATCVLIVLAWFWKLGLIRHWWT